MQAQADQLAREGDDVAGLREAIWTIIKLHDRPLGLSISMRCRRALVVRSVPVLRPMTCRRWRDKTKNLVRSDNHLKLKKTNAA